MTVIWYINGDSPFLLALTLTGCLNLVLGAKGKIAGLYFAIINCLLYSYQCMGVKLYGEVMYNMLFSIPVSAIAIYLWNKNKDDDGKIRFKVMPIESNNSNFCWYINSCIFICKGIEFIRGKFSIYGFFNNCSFCCC